MITFQRLPRRNDLRFFRSQIVFLNAEFLASFGRRGGGRRVVPAAAFAASQHLLRVEPRKLLLNLQTQDSDNIDALLLVQWTGRTSGEVSHERDDAQHVLDEFWVKDGGKVCKWGMSKRQLTEISNVSTTQFGLVKLILTRH